ncbi:MAG: alpha/beta hydrolase-fold protein [Kiritimatiellae bacterium]|nr:alpha/beta hydrolase-fold protein [Kiritimatiellia bacterium]
MDIKFLFVFTASLLSWTLTAAADTPIIQHLTNRIDIVSFYSEVLEKTKSFSVVLPENYDHAKSDWPVLFLLHGRGRTERSLIDDEGARSSLLEAPFVVILPDGDDGWYIDSPVRPADKYQSYTEEVVALAGTLYNLTSNPEQRALTGWSMGGYGCVYFAENHSQEFSTVASIIGLLDFPRTGLPEGQSYDVPIDRFGDDPAVWATFNPINHVENLRDMSIYVVIADEAFDRTMNENFTNELTIAGIAHEVKVLEGGHTFAVVCTALPLVINFVAKSFKSATVLPPVTAGLLIGVDGSNATTSNGAVSSWNNQVTEGGARDFIQTVAANRPGVLTDFAMPNGSLHTILNFNGSNQYMSLDSESSLSTNLFTILAVVRGNAMEDGATGYFLSTYDTAVRWGMGERAGNNMWFLLARGTTLLIPNITGITQDQWYIVSMSWNGVTGELSGRSLNQSGTLATLLNTGAFNTSRPHIRTRLGCNSDSSTLNYFFDGQIAEILVYNRVLPTDDLLNVEDYLNYKYLQYWPKGTTLAIK